jgi:hypothetical protein
MSEEVSQTVLNLQTGNSATFKFFTDDTIETVQNRIGILIGVHPDRLRIYVEGQFEGDYYAKDSRKWENLFLRMSPEGKPIRKSLDYYNSARDPPFVFDQTSYDKSAWMAIDSTSDAPFRERRLLGVTEDRSWVYPQNNTDVPEHLPPSAKVTIDVRALFKTLHPNEIVQFVVIPQTPLVPQLELLYYPRLRPTSPAKVLADVEKAIGRQSDLVRAVSSLSVPVPTKVSINQVRWKLPLVNTDFGHAIRNRFEQIFYGTTVSPDVPVITFFSSRQEQSRHKFFTENDEKTPLLDVRTWSYWWNATKPSKNKPALIIYRGKARGTYDRITVNSTEITISCSRGEEGSDTHYDLQKSAKEFLQSIDGLAAFLDPADYDDDRWELQDMSGVIHYDTPLKEADFRRFDCLRSIYDVSDKDKLVFKFLRTDDTDIGLSDNEMRVLNMLKDSETLTPDDIHDQLPDVSVSDATALLEKVKQLLSDNPDLGERHYSAFPTFKLATSKVAVTHAPDMKRVVSYISALRDILIRPDNPDLDDVCPKRMEIVESETAAIPEETPAAAAEEDSFLDELLGDIAGIGTAEKKEEPKVEKKTAAKKVKPKGAKTSLADYFLRQLREFDPETYDPSESDVYNKCDKPRQPIVLKDSELSKFDSEEMAMYDPRTAGTAGVLDVKDPDGIIICPEYWCTADRIPLKEAQLVDGKCPVCEGKVRSTVKAEEKTQDVVEYSVIKRDATSVYPGYIKYKSKKSGKQIPCCYTTAQTTKISYSQTAPATKEPEPYYVLGETKTRLEELRIAYIPKAVGRALGIPLEYKATVEAMNRIQSGQSGYFRVGVGHAAETLGKLLGVSTKIPSPLVAPEVTKRCSFFRSWSKADLESVDDKLSARVFSIGKAFEEKSLTPLEELEYTALTLNCMVYAIYVKGDDIHSTCFMNIGAVRRTNKAVLVLVDGNDMSSVDYVAHVSRTSTLPVMNGNLYMSLFPKDLVPTLETLRAKSCVRDIPTVDKAVAFISKSALKDRLPEFKVVLDPYARAQALFLPNIILLPFRPTSQIPTFLDERVAGYSEIAQSDYPPKAEMMEFLKQAADIHPGYAYAHDAANAKHIVTELVVRSGLRIPVLTDEVLEGDPTEITETVDGIGENTLVYGKPDPESVKTARAVTYEAEIFEFLLYQLTHDMQGEDYAELRRVLAQSSPDIKELRPLVKAWVDDTLTFSEADEPPTFYSKMRHSCTGAEQSDCSGLCVWDGASCKVQVKQVRPTLERTTLESRLISTLASNDKIRSVVFENRVSPFFSSILYLELPSEVILSDGDVAAKLKE